MKKIIIATLATISTVVLLAFSNSMERDPAYSYINRKKDTIKVEAKRHSEQKTNWKEIKSKQNTLSSRAVYAPFNLNKILNDTDIIFDGIVLDCKEYEVEWYDDNGKKWGPFPSSTIDVRIKEIYYGETDKNNIRIYYPQYISTSINGSFKINNGDEFIFMANCFDRDFYDLKASNPDDRFEQDKYADVYITNSRDAIMPVIEDNVTVFIEYFINNEEALDKAFSVDKSNGKVPKEAQESNCFICYYKNDFIDLIKKMMV